MSVAAAIRPTVTATSWNSTLDVRPARVDACDDPRMTDCGVRLAFEPADADVSRALQRAFFADIASFAYRRVRLNTGDRQPEALALSRAAGYVEVDDFNGYAFAHHWMEKEL